MQQVKTLGEILRISSIPVNSHSFIPGIPLGDIGDEGIVNKVYSNYFQLLRSDGKLRAYPLNVETKQISAATLTAKLRSVLAKRYSSIFGKGDSFNLGSDPEIFVLDQFDTVIPAWNYLPKAPDHTPKQGRGFNFSDASAFYDGVQAEFQTIPALCLAYHVDSIQAGFSRVLQAARKFNPLAKLSSAPVVSVPQDILDTADETYVMLGCAPSQNIYPDVRPIYIENPRALQIRFAGGHIHIGKIIAEALLSSTVKSLDSILGVCATALLDGLDDPRRRSYYGRAGEFRLPPHGLEYRTLSSAINMHPAMTHLAFDLGRQTVWAVERGYNNLWTCSEQEARDAIDHSDYKLARKIVRRNISYLRAVLMTIYGTTVADPSKATTTALRLILEGARNLLPTDMEANWKLDRPVGEAGGWKGHSEVKDGCMTQLQL